MNDPVTIKLSRPLVIIDQPVTSLTLREPTGRDIVASGYPLKFSGEGGTEVHADAMSKLIARIGNVPVRAMEAMPATDWQACCLEVMGFFALPASLETSSDDTSSSPAGGAT
jgi:hypothetical protein